MFTISPLFMRNYQVVILLYYTQILNQQKLFKFEFNAHYYTIYIFNCKDTN